MKDTWLYRRGDIYLVDLGRTSAPSKGVADLFFLYRIMWETTTVPR